MKFISLFTIVSILTTLSLRAQDSAAPPMPGFATPPQARTPGSTESAAPAATTPAAEAAEPEETADTTTAAPAEEKAAAAGNEIAEAKAEPAPASDSAPTPAAGSTPADGSSPPVPGSDPKKVDFLQRSNLILAKLLENERPMDPFGLVMDPANAKAAPVLADQYEEVEETPQINSSSLKSALMTLPITGIYPQRKILVLGARTFEVGGQFGMKLQDLTIRLRFEGIRDGEIFFKDMETREVTSIPFNPRPAEFEPIAKGEKREPGQGISSMSDLFIAN